MNKDKFGHISTSTVNDKEIKQKMKQFMEDLKKKFKNYSFFNEQAFRYKKPSVPSFNRIEPCKKKAKTFCAIEYDLLKDSKYSLINFYQDLSLIWYNCIRENYSKDIELCAKGKSLKDYLKKNIRETFDGLFLPYESLHKKYEKELDKIENTNSNFKKNNIIKDPFMEESSDYYNYKTDSFSSKKRERPFMSSDKISPDKKLSKNFTFNENMDFFGISKTKSKTLFFKENDDYSYSYKDYKEEDKNIDEESEILLSDHESIPKVRKEQQSYIDISSDSPNKSMHLNTVLNDNYFDAGFNTFNSVPDSLNESNSKALNKMENKNDYQLVTRLDEIQKNRNKKLENKFNQQIKNFLSKNDSNVIILDDDLIEPKTYKIIDHCFLNPVDGISALEQSNLNAKVQVLSKEAFTLFLIKFYKLSYRNIEFHENKKDIILHYERINKEEYDILDKFLNVLLDTNNFEVRKKIINYYNFYMEEPYNGFVPSSLMEQIKLRLKK